MAQFTVDSDALERSVAHVTSTSACISTEVSSMLSQLSALEATWSGGASASFQAVVEEWRGVNASVEQALARINEALRHAAMQYADVERANLQMFSA